MGKILRQELGSRQRAARQMALWQHAQARRELDLRAPKQTPTTRKASSAAKADASVAKADAAKMPEAPPSAPVQGGSSLPDPTTATIALSVLLLAAQARGGRALRPMRDEAPSFARAAGARAAHFGASPGSVDAAAVAAAVAELSADARVAKLANLPSPPAPSLINAVLMGQRAAQLRR